MALTRFTTPTKANKSNTSWKMNISTTSQTPRLHRSSKRRYARGLHVHRNTEPSMEGCAGMSDRPKRTAKLGLVDGILEVCNDSLRAFWRRNPSGYPLADPIEEDLLP